jgi:hypothetical protein
MYFYIMLFMREIFHVAQFWFLASCNLLYLSSVTSKDKDKLYIIEEFTGINVSSCENSQGNTFAYLIKHLFILNSEKHNTRELNNLYQPTTNFWVHQKGVYCMGIRVYNNLPPHIKDISQNPRKFEICLKHFLHLHYFYSIGE